MKGILSISIICLLLLFPGCISPYFTTGNDLYLKPATVFLNDGTIKEGNITIQLENNVEATNYIDLVNKETRQAEKISIFTIKYYRIGNDYYVPKMVDLNLNGGHNFLFLKRLTDENSRIQLYELQEVHKRTSTGDERKLYYISLPSLGRYEVLSTYGKRLSPDFPEKMSNIVADCPSLAKKIRDREVGYFLGNFIIPDSKRVEVLMRIIAEYDSCR